MKRFLQLLIRFGRKSLSGVLMLMLFIGISMSLLSLSPSELTNDAEFPKIITQENSGLPSNQILSLCIDSSNVAWIGTDNGLARFDAKVLTIYSTENGLASKQVNDLAMDYSGNGPQLLIATNQGLTIADVTADGIENANSFTDENSEMVGLNASNVVVDTKNTRWISTNEAVNVMDGEKWVHESTAVDGDQETFNFAQNIVTDMEYYAYDSLTLISTAGRGIVRMRYNKVDGITGASTFGLPWATLTSNYITSIAVKGVDQWYGGNSGVDYHASRYTKNDWENFSTENHLLDNDITCVAIDKSDNIWIGTSKGLSIISSNGDVLKYTESEGLVNNQVNLLTTDTKGNVWVGTSGGVQWFENNPGVDATTAIPLHLVKQDIKVYPNPAKDQILIDLKNIGTSREVKISIYNYQGQLIAVPFQNSVDKENLTISIDIANRNIYKKGLYLLRIDTNKTAGITKLNIE